MSVEREVEKQTKQATENKIRLSEGKQKDLLAGVTEQADGIKGNTDGLDELQDTLMGYQLNSEREIVWVREILLPNSSEETDNRTIRTSDNEVAVEFLLPSGDTFWREYDLPAQTWDDDNEFAELLDVVGIDVSTLEMLPGEQLDVKFDDANDEWLLVDLETGSEEVGGEDYVEETYTSTTTSSSSSSTSTERDDAIASIAGSIIGFSIFIGLPLVLFLWSVSPILGIIGLFTFFFSPTIGLLLYGNEDKTGAEKIYEEFYE